jgi:hypothetical protein
MALVVVSCGLTPEHVSHDDPRLTPLFDAMARVDRRAMGFTSIEGDASIRIEWVHRTFDSLLGLGSKNYDAMLHVYGKTSRTVAFKRVRDGYEWIGEQETFEGPHRYDSVDGPFNEAVIVTYERVRMSGVPTNTIAIDYRGEEPELAGLRQLSLDDVRPWLKKWGYD